MTAKAVKGRASFDVETLDGSWELPELASLALLLCVLLLAVGAAISGWLYAIELRNEMVGVVASLGWTALQFGTRDITPTTASLLLGALAAVWWQYTQWTNIALSDADEGAAVIHVGRIRSLTRWIVIGFAVVVLSTLGYLAATIALNAGRNSVPYAGSSDVSAATSTLAIVIIAGLGLVAARRLWTAVSAYLSQN